MTTRLKCPICDSERAFAQVSRRVVQHQGLTAEYEVISSHCQSCDNDFASPDQLAANKRSAIKAEAGLMGMPEPSELIAWRKRFGLTQERAGKLLGVGPVAFCKYETLAMLPSAPTARLARAVIHSPQVTLDLAESYHVPLRERTVVLAAKSPTASAIAVDSRFVMAVGGSSAAATDWITARSRPITKHALRLKAQSGPHFIFKSKGAQ